MQLFQISRIQTKGRYLQKKPVIVVGNSNSSGLSELLQEIGGLEVVWMKKNKLSAYIYILPAVGFVGIFLIYPIIFNFMSSFTEWRGLDFSTAEFVGMQNPSGPESIFHVSGVSDDPALSCGRYRKRTV